MERDFSRLGLEPKRPTNAFLLFCKEARPKLAKNLAVGKPVDNRKISRRLGFQWSRMTPEERQPFELKAAGLMALAKEEHPGWKFKYDQQWSAPEWQGSECSTRLRPRDKVGFKLPSTLVKRYRKPQEQQAGEEGGPLGGVPATLAPPAVSDRHGARVKTLVKRPRPPRSVPHGRGKQADALLRGRSRGTRLMKPVPLPKGQQDSDQDSRTLAGQEAHAWERHPRTPQRSCRSTRLRWIPEKPYKFTSDYPQRPGNGGGGLRGFYLGRETCEFGMKNQRHDTSEHLESSSDVEDHKCPIVRAGMVQSPSDGKPRGSKMPRPEDADENSVLGELERCNEKYLRTCEEVTSRNLTLPAERESFVATRSEDGTSGDRQSTSYSDADHSQPDEDDANDSVPYSKELLLSVLNLVRKLRN